MGSGYSRVDEMDYHLKWTVLKRPLSQNAVPNSSWGQPSVPDPSPTWPIEYGIWLKTMTVYQKIEYNLQLCWLRVCKFPKKLHGCRELSVLDPEPKGHTIIKQTIFWKFVYPRLTSPSDPIKYSILRILAMHEAKSVNTPSTKNLRWTFFNNGP